MGFLRLHPLAKLNRRASAGVKATKRSAAEGIAESGRTRDTISLDDSHRRTYSSSNAGNDADDSLDECVHLPPPSPTDDARLDSLDECVHVPLTSPTELVRIARSRR